MGHIFSQIIYQKDVIVNDEIMNVHDALIVSCIKYPKKDKFIPNHLIGYNHSVILNDFTFIKYENGKCLYTTQLHSVHSLFGERMQCDIINDIRIRTGDENEDKNMKMYIQLTRNGNGEIIAYDLYL
jgi:hypothetical protein